MFLELLESTPHATWMINIRRILGEKEELEKSTRDERGTRYVRQIVKSPAVVLVFPLSPRFLNRFKNTSI